MGTDVSQCPIRSVLWRELFPTVSRREVQSDSYTTRSARSIPSPQLSRSDFPDLSPIALGYPGENPHPDDGVFNTSVRVHSQFLSLPPPSFTHTLFSSFAKTGPFIGRLVATSSISAPQFTITLQRDTVDVGGNAGLLSIGEFPTGIDERNLTWAKVRTYSVHEGGLPPPANSPGEVNSCFFEWTRSSLMSSPQAYPITWEVFVDDVYLDGVKLPRSNLSSPLIAVSALIDTVCSQIHSHFLVTQSQGLGKLSRPRSRRRRRDHPEHPVLLRLSLVPTPLSLLRTSHSRLPDRGAPLSDRPARFGPAGV